MTEETQATPSDDDIYEEEDTSPEAELASLKERAKAMGLRVSPKIGLEALRKKVNDALTGTDQDDEDNADDQSTRPLSKKEQFMATRERLIRENLSLKRVRISCLNPDKVEWPGEIISVGNKYLGTIAKFIPFGEMTDNGYHVPQILLNELRNRQFLQKRSVTDQRTGRITVKTRFVSEFAIDELEPLTEAEVEKLAARQRATQGLEE